MVTNHPKREWSKSCDPFFKFCANNIFATGVARHFKFHALIDTEEYECICDYYSQKGRVLSHVSSLIVENKNNISETVQDRDIAAMED